MGKIRKKISIIIFLLFGLFFNLGSVNAENYSSGFIKINDYYNYKDENLSMIRVYFNKNTSNFGEITSYGTLFGDMVNLSGYYLSAYMTIDYYDANYNIVARSTKTEKPGDASQNYQMSISLYENDFLGEANINDIVYYRVSYYLVKGNSLPNSNNNYSDDSSTIYNNSEYYLNSYDINMVVNENNTLKITEKIGAYFNVNKHGIFRKIPLKNTITRLDGTTSSNRTKISDINVNDTYKAYNENGYKVIRVGDANYTVTGQKDYTISYLYNLGKDTGKDYDELYFNLIGNEWDTSISNVTFTITMPKEFDESKLGFSSGKVGSIDSSKVTFSVNDNVITGKLNGTLNSGEALTVRLELPEGYFVGASTNLDLMMVIAFVLPIFFVLIAFIIWIKFGKDNQVIETVEFYPPGGFNSLEVGYLYKGKADNQDVTSLLVYLANKGYIKISEFEEKSLFSNSKGFKITKLKDYDGNNYNERLFLNGLFFGKSSMYSNDNGIVEVTKNDLYNTFYVTMNNILSNINSRQNNEKIFEKVASSKKIFLILMIIATYCLITIPPFINSGYLSNLIVALLFPSIGFTVLISMVFGKTQTIYVNGKPTYSAIVTKLFGLIWGGMFGGMPWLFIVLPVLLQDSIYLIIYLIGLVCVILLLITIKYLPKRTPYGTEMLGKLRGFKNFLETAEKDKLEAMVMQNPSYFYDILPYTYVLGVSDKWIKKFESISLQEPTWYVSSTGFNVHTFGNFMNSTMTSARTAMISSPSSSSGGSSSRGSGGGSSGGGSGGGGGGSW